MRNEKVKIIAAVTRVLEEDYKQEIYRALEAATVQLRLLIFVVAPEVAVIVMLLVMVMKFQTIQVIGKRVEDVIKMAHMLQARMCLKFFVKIILILVMLQMHPMVILSM